ncbi:MAG: FtsX-like permease family protein [Thermodesulfobacteria bacterium]|nr:FtsX-like permease family protein [Thermodesulfobacteriota bacterium]
MSFFKGLLKETFKELLSSKVNLVFMLLAMIISLTALNTIYSLGMSAKHQIIKILESVQFGKDAMVIVAGGGRIIGLTTTRSDTLKMGDVKALEKLDFVKLASPISLGYMDVGYKGTVEKMRIEGVYPNYTVATNWYPQIGRFITKKDLKSMAKVCVIGSAVPKKFHMKKVLGTYIKLAGQYFEIVGVLEPKTFFGHFSRNERILIPLTTAQKRVFHVNYLSAVKLLFRPGTDMKLAKKVIRKILRKRHHLFGIAPDDFRMITPELALSVFSKAITTINMFLLSISIISLTISGVIIMNLMYANIEEKAPVIALRIAIGASSFDIILHYLIMSLWIALISGFLGWLFSVGILKLISMVSPLKPEFSVSSFVLSFCFAGSTCVLFTLIPAIRASRVEPSLLLKSL